MSEDTQETDWGEPQPIPAGTSDNKNTRKQNATDSVQASRMMILSAVITVINDHASVRTRVTGAYAYEAAAPIESISGIYPEYIRIPYRKIGERNGRIVRQKLYLLCI